MKRKNVVCYLCGCQTQAKIPLNTSTMKCSVVLPYGHRIKDAPYVCSECYSNARKFIGGVTDEENRKRVR
jgi:hypothetical protein